MPHIVEPTPEVAQQPCAQGNPPNPPTKTACGTPDDQPTLHISAIRPPKLEIRDTRDTDKLEASIAVEGILHPLLVAETDEPGIYEIIDGYTRYLVALKLGIQRLPVTIRPAPADDAERLKLQLTSNTARNDMAPAELANWYMRLMLLKDFNQRKLSAFLGVNECQVSKVLKVFRSLAPEFHGKLPATVAYALTKLPVELQIPLGQDYLKGNLTRDDIVAEVARILARQQGGKLKPIEIRLPSGAVMHSVGTFDQIIADAGAIIEAAQRGKKNGLEPCHLPQLVKGKGAA